MKFQKILFLCTISLLLWKTGQAETFDWSSWEKQTTVKKLDNGLTLVVVRHEGAPVFAYSLQVDVGSAQEEIGKTGLAHMFEHMAFKGTTKIGTNNYEKEKGALAAIEIAYLAYEKERRTAQGPDQKKLLALQEAWQKSIKAAEPFVIANDFAGIIGNVGCKNIYAGTGADRTEYGFSCPINAFHLWAYLESERMLHPVFRQFYQERNVVIEERNMRYESSINGKIWEQFFAAAFTAHPYGQPTIGWRSDLDHLSITDALAFYKKYYVPANMVLTVVGDVDANKVIPVLSAYFGRLPKGPKPPILVTEEPKQHAERMVILQEAAQPRYMEGYMMPSSFHVDAPIYDILADLLATGNTSWLYQSLVNTQKLIPDVSIWTGMPGDKYPNLFTLSMSVSKNHTVAEVREALHQELNRLKTELVTEEELIRVRNKNKLNLFRLLQSNTKIASKFGKAQLRHGDWRYVFHYLEKLDQVKASDVKRVAETLFLATNRTSAWIQNPADSQTTVTPKEKTGPKEKQ